ncbi:hypothetical protein [Streptosporangium jomthongense]|uniref:Uncharacterized protein n=1 Tax=Streptosporangium jomthongense TaxID=1193683 RepID=A0ABV8FBU7_9ACTN
MRALIILGVVALIVLGLVALSLIHKRADRARANRLRAHLHESKLHELHRIAIEHQGAGNPLADLFELEIRAYLTETIAKEHNR